MGKLATDRPVVVTGASGFVAAEIVRDLLERGYRVRGTVRDPKNAKKTEPLVSLPGASDRLELVGADLTRSGSFDEAVKGADIVMHTASPYVIDVEDPKRDLVDPAVMGTRTVLESVKKAGDARRVVLTSSFAAVTDEPIDGHVYTESDWNDRSSLERNPYYYSKVLAERAAWDFVESDSPGFDLVTVNPMLVIGPSLIPGLNQSNRVITDLLTGKVPAIVRLTWGIVDVRDVARAYVFAMEKPNAKGRYVCAEHAASMRDVVDLLRELGFASYKLPKMGLDSPFGDHVAKLGAIFQPKGTRSYLRSNIGRRAEFDCSKIKRELGLEFRPLAETLKDTVGDLVRWGHVPEKKAA